MIFLGLDFETTGLNCDADQIIDVGLAIWNTTTGQPVRLIGVLVTEAEGETTQRPISAEITTLTGITGAMLASPHAMHMTAALGLIARMMKTADAVVAHSGLEFDQLFLAAHFTRYGIEMPPTPWIDTKLDLDWPENVTTRKLTYLAAEAGFVNPFPHRALFDAVTMMTLLQRRITSGWYTDARFVEQAASPLMTVQADVSFEKKDLAKARGYYWKPETKSWLKSLRHCNALKEQENAPFPVSIRPWDKRDRSA